MKKKPTKKPIKKPKVKSQKQCDDLLTPLVKLKHPYCLLCGKPTQVAHHHVHKSKSLILRHDEENIINLCNSCHCALHHNESYYASKIIQIKGLPWFESLERKKNGILRYPDYNAIYERLQSRIQELSVDGYKTII